MKVANAVILLYYIIHLPITILIDSQVIFPPQYYPTLLTNMVNDYVVTLEDNMVGTKPAWYWGLCSVEIFCQTPFFLLSIYAFLMRRNWIRIPTIIYGSHVATTIIPMFATILFDQKLKPNNEWAQVALLAIYGVWFVFPIWMALYAWANENLFEEKKSKNTVNNNNNNNKKKNK